VQPQVAEKDQLSMDGHVLSGMLVEPDDNPVATDGSRDGLVALTDIFSGPMSRGWVADTFLYQIALAATRRAKPGAHPAIAGDDFRLGAPSTRPHADLARQLASNPGRGLRAHDVLSKRSK
jgi:hypothetical protein